MIVKKDIQYKTDDGYFNCRVVGVCVKNNKVFLSKLKEDEYWTFIGGKSEFGEATDEAIIREYKEETGATLQINRLLAVIENFFDMDNSNWHQLIFFYLLNDDNNELEDFDGYKEVNDNSNAIYQWINLKQIDSLNIKPNCAQQILKKIPKNIVHYIDRDN